MSFILPITIAAAAFFWAGLTYNRIIRLQHKSDAAWSDVDVQLQRRFDLIPNLVKVVKTYATHEKNTLEELTLQRATANNVGARAEQENQIAHQVNNLLILAERYPELKASSNFADLHKSLITIEDDIQFARRYFNGNVRDYNVQIQSFPALLLAKPLGFHTRDYFEIELVTQRNLPEMQL